MRGKDEQRTLKQLQWSKCKTVTWQQIIIPYLLIVTFYANGFSSPIKKGKVAEYMLKKISLYADYTLGHRSQEASLVVQMVKHLPAKGET